VKLNKVKISILLTILVLIFVACEDNSVGVKENIQKQGDVIDYSVMDAEDAVEDLGEATESENMKWGKNVPTNFKKKFLKKRVARMHLGKILKDLELSDEQNKKLKTIFENHYSLAKAVHEDFKSKVKSIIDKAKASRKVIIDKLKTGEMTKEEAKKELKILSKETKKKIQATDAFTAVKAELCILKKKLVNNIAAILTEKQLVKWNEWLSNYKGNCLNS